MNLGAIAALLFVMWTFAVVFHVTLGGFIHVLLVAALVAVIAQLISSRRIA